jgi:hypothetical protein
MKTKKDGSVPEKYRKLFLETRIETNIKRMYAFSIYSVLPRAEQFPEQETGGKLPVLEGKRRPAEYAASTKAMPGRFPLSQ